MKNIFLVFMLCVLGCKDKNQNETVISGEIYIKLIDVHRTMYGMPKDKIESVLKRIAAETDKDSLNSSELEVREYYEFLAQENLIDKPYFKVKINNEGIIRVLTTEEEYLKLKPDIENLNRETEKIAVKFKGREIKNGIFFADNIINVKKEKGKTDWAK